MKNMKINLKYFLGKKRTTFLKYCVANKIKTYAELKRNLGDNRVECPTREEFDSVMKRVEKKSSFKRNPTVILEKPQGAISKKQVNKKVKKTVRKTKLLKKDIENERP